MIVEREMEKGMQRCRDAIGKSDEQIDGDMDGCWWMDRWKDDGGKRA